MDYSTSTRNTLTAFFADRSAADQAAQELLRNGFSSNQVEVTSADDFTSYIGSGNTGLTGKSPHDTSGGGISGFFHRIFGSEADEHDRTYYSEASRRAKAAVIVHADDNSIDRAAETLNRYGAVELQDTANTPSVKSKESGSRLTDDRRNTGDAAIPVVREELQVGKRAVQRGAVRIHTHMTDRPAEERVELREERVRVDRHPTDRPATQADLAAAQRDVIEVTETVEEPVVNKRARVVEEVVVGKEVHQRTETVRDNLRQSEVHVEDTRSDRTRSVGTDDIDADFQTDFRSRYGSNRETRYEDYAPAYRYGYDMASDPRYRGRRFSDVEEDLRTDYTRRYPNSTWERIKASVQYGWDKVTGKR